MPTKLGASLGIPWEKDYATMGSVQMRDAIYVAAQLGWNEEGIVKGETIESQARRAYANIEKLLVRHGAKLTDVVEETVYVVDMKAALPILQPLHRELYGEDPLVASSVVEVKSLADPKARVAIKVTAKLDLPVGSFRGDSGEQRSSPRSGGGRSRGGGRGGMGGGGGYGGSSPY